ncbi:MAG: amidohydrolase [Bacteroidales bacterium]|nr:amidohydrolase [Bacteroidales bacterium]
MNQKIINLRRELHQNPELSNKEVLTSERIIHFLKDYRPDKIVRLGETGVVFVFSGSVEGKTILFRAELDALPIQETTHKAYKSANQQISHVCGHDGHMAILAGLAQKISQNPPKKGKVLLLFQPAEEVEQGALEVVENPNFKTLNPDYLFALHNVPGFKKHSILLKKGSFASGSKGMTVKLTGKTTHAAEPQNGISPANAIAEIIHQLHSLRENKTLFSDFILLTIIHIQLGEISFGTSPGYAEMRITLRAYENKDLDLLTHHCEKITQEISSLEKLKCEFSYSEVFPATVNNDFCVELVEQSAKQLNLEVQQLKTPFKWSEDFGYYTEKYKACFFGLGSGVDQPQLHNPDFDFPDDIIETGIDLFYSIYQNIPQDD